MPVLHLGAHDGGPQAGATPRELMGAIWMAAEMRAGGAYAHSNLMLDTLNDLQAKQSGGSVKPG